MKYLYIVLAALLLCGILLGCAKNAAPKPSVSWRVDSTGKYLADDAVRQVITVQAGAASEARITLYEKSKVNGKNVWTETLRCEGFIGQKGLGKTREGDRKTPIGEFGIVTAFGIKENPGTSLPYIDVTENIYACCDAECYNQIVDIREHPHENPEDEHMIDYSPEYNYGFMLDYNPERQVGKGNSIFFHCRGANPYTAGCIALAEEDMIQLLRAVDANARIVIDYLPM